MNQMVEGFAWDFSDDSQVVFYPDPTILMYLEGYLKSSPYCCPEAFGVACSLYLFDQVYSFCYNCVPFLCGQQVSDDRRKMMLRYGLIFEVDHDNRVVLSTLVSEEEEVVCFHNFVEVEEEVNVR